jgi:hypothetical protein
VPDILCELAPALAIKYLNTVKWLPSARYVLGTGTGTGNKIFKNGKTVKKSDFNFF